MDATGVVDFFNDTGGYGFIETEAVEEDVFFHMEDVGGPDLVEGTEVAFDIKQADKGPRAKNIKRLESPDTWHKQTTSQTDTDAETANRRRDATGVVDFFNDTGGYGFIKTDTVQEDVFFHMEDVGGPDLAEGTEVAFDIKQFEKGPRATNIIRNPDNVTITGTGSTGDSANNTEVFADSTEQSGDTDTKVYTADGSDGGSSASDTATINNSWCPSCGTALEELANPNFCPDCGTKLKTS